jgi:hypothetical protein
MAQHAHLTREFSQTEEAVTVLFCLIDDAYRGSSTQKANATSSSRGSRTPRCSPWRSSGSFVAWRASALSCVTWGQVLRPPVPRGSGPGAFLAAPSPSQAAALPGAPQTRRPAPARGRPRNPHRRLDVARGAASQTSPAIGRLRGGRVGPMGLLQRLRSKALHLLCATNGVPVSYELTPARTSRRRCA